jgi:hypothetical protein
MASSYACCNRRYSTHSLWALITTIISPAVKGLLTVPSSALPGAGDESYLEKLAAEVRKDLG